MLRQYELIEKVRAYDPDADEAMINRAYVFSMKAHGSQKRASGDPYFSHPIEVAGILTRYDVLGRVALAQGRPDEAIASLQTALQLYEGKPLEAIYWLAEAHAAWGLSLKERGRTAESAHHLRAALEINPEFAVVRQALIEIEAGGGEATTNPTSQPDAIVPQEQP